MTIFKAALSVCGLSQVDAARITDKSLDTIKSYCNGRIVPPGSVWRQLAILFDQVVQTSENALDLFEMDELTPDYIQELNVEEFGAPLPDPAAEAAAAMFFLTRMLDNNSD